MVRDEFKMSLAVIAAAVAVVEIGNVLRITLSILMQLALSSPTGLVAICMLYVDGQEHAPDSYDGALGLPYIRYVVVIITYIPPLVFVLRFRWLGIICNSHL